MNRATGPAPETASLTVADGAEHTSQRIRVLIALVTLYIIWSSGFLAIKLAIETIPPLLMTGTRLLIAGGALYIVERLRGAPNPRRAEWLGVVVVAGFLLVGGNGGIVVAEQWVDSGVTAVEFATAPLWTAILGGMTGAWPGRFEWVGIGVGFLGVVLLQSHANLRAHPLGAAILMLASMSWAAGSVAGRGARLPAGLMASAATMLLGGAVLCPLGLLCGERLTAMPSALSLAAFAYLIFISSLLGFSLYTYLIRNTHTTLAVSYTFVQPVFAVVLGALLIGERVSGNELVAMLLALAGLLFLTRGAGQRA